MRINSRKVIKTLESFAPERYAQDWDNVGFQIGDINSKIEKIMVTLDITKEVLIEAVENNVDLIITHHPLIFNPIKKIVSHNPVSNLIMDLITNKINVIVAHTNLDSSNIGVNMYLSKLLNLNRVTNLSDAYYKKYFKFIVFVPKDFSGKVLTELENANAGIIGNYSGCTFNTEGYGTFRPLENSNPYVGQKNELHKESEIKIETIVEEKNLENVINKIMKIHPYETPAYDIIPLENSIDNPNMGLVGYLENAMDIVEFSKTLKDVLKASNIKLVKANERKIHKIALCTGASSEFIDTANSKDCDLFITGDLKYHEAQHAKQIGLNVIDAGHYETENIYIEEFARILREKFEEENYDVIVVQSKVNINPFKNI